ncbi:glycosyltransferase family 2 protein [Breznakia pachnodae]|uniref:Glycosyltransferase involved in cell wall biosynthesis n=1 Tax=Breznakia pachnodae TaxID=265178 RepID=A0ABU0DYU5_9FIRM|nr:glycosyltransferase family 2 protein [Breznakia pachnodae]MDQ0359797.1 glycosyltransferase involved in cell wall biosynthesis [Breznakia pachnodae]
MDYKVLVIIPAYNEEENILKTYKTLLDYPYDVIVINDGSLDSTQQICEENNIPHINLIHNLGIGGAVQTGYKYAVINDYDIAIQFDGDGQHDAAYIQSIIQPIIDDTADFVIGSRFVGEKSSFQSSASRRAGIKVISAWMRLFTKQKIYDTTSGFRASNKKVFHEFANIYPIEYPEPITTTEVLKKQYRVSEVAVDMKERMGGKSSIHTWKNAYYMINVLISIFVVATRRYK